MSLNRILTVLLAVSVTIFGAHFAKAQSEPDDFLDDDEPFDEPVDKAQPGQGPRQRGPNVPPAFKNPNQGNSNDNKNSGPSFTPPSSNSGEVAFRLTDPPKFWKAKKRHHRSREADKSESTRRQAEVKAASTALPPSTSNPLATPPSAPAKSVK